VKNEKPKSDAGISLLEVTAALILIGIAAVGVFRLHVADHWNLQAYSGTSVSPQGAPATVDEMGRNIRLAGMGLPQSIAGIRTFDSNPDSIAISFATCETALARNMTSSSASFAIDMDRVSCIKPNSWLYLYDHVQDDGEWTEVESIDSSTGHIRCSQDRLSRAYPKGTTVYNIARFKYYLDQASDNDRSRLVLQYHDQPPQVYAVNISDLQFKYRLKSGAVVDNPSDPTSIREVMVEITGPADDRPPTARNRTVAGPLKLATSVFLKNLGS